MINNSLQGSLQEAIRSALGCANTFEGDLHALCDLYGIASGHQDARLIGAAQKHDSTIGTASGALNYFLLNPSTLPTFGLNFVDGSGRLDSRVTFTRASGASQIDATKSLVAASVNQPRFDCDPITGLIKGLLIEEQRTRINTISAAPTAPENVTVTAQAYTLSFYGTGQIVLSGAASQTITGSGAFPSRQTVTFTPTAGTLTITPSGSVQYLQVEAGSFATSVMLGEGTQVTRAADVAVVSSLAGWFNASEGTLLTDFTVGVISPSAAQALFSLTAAGTENDRMIGFLNTGTGISTFSGSIGGAAQFNITSSAASALVRSRASFTYKASDQALSFNGGAVVTNSTGTIPTVTQLSIGDRATGGRSLNGWLRRVAYYPTRLPNATLQALAA